MGDPPLMRDFRTGDRTETLRVRVSPDELAVIQAARGRSNRNRDRWEQRNLSEWCRAVLLRASKQHPAAGRTTSPTEGRA